MVICVGDSNGEFVRIKTFVSSYFEKNVDTPPKYSKFIHKLTKRLDFYRKKIQIII